jgi:hypothetical protein
MQVRVTLLSLPGEDWQDASRVLQYGLLQGRRFDLDRLSCLLLCRRRDLIIVRARSQEGERGPELGRRRPGCGRLPQ